MTDLASWLLSQIAADEAAARAAIRPETVDGWANAPVPADSGRWKVAAEAGELDDRENWYAIEDEQSGEIIVYNESRPDADQAAHIARHDPARVLAECAAKKAIVELHQSWPVLVETPPEFTSDTTDINAMSISMSQRMMWMTAQEYRARFGDEPPTAPVLRLLAQPYADREGFDPAWKVEP